MTFVRLVPILAALALAACNSSDGADEQAQKDSVEVAAEQAVGGLDQAAVPIADPGAAATDSPAVPAGPQASESAAEEVAQ